MATPTWGSPVGPSGQMVRVGIAMVVPTPSAGQSTVSVTAEFYVQTMVSVFDTNNAATIDASYAGGDFSGSLSFDTRTNDLGYWDDSNRRLLKTITVSVATAYSSSTLTNSFTLGNIDFLTTRGYNTAPTVSVSRTLPARPYSAPPVPPTASAVRNSDTKFTVTWTAPSTTSGNPVQGYRILRYSSDDGNGKIIANTAAGALSYEDMSTRSNSAYSYSVAAFNSGGDSAWRSTGSNLYTTPTAPTGVSVAKQVSDIVVTWTDASRIESGFRVYDYIDEAPTPTLVHTTASGATTWTYSTADPAKRHRMAVSAIAPNGLESPLAVSGTTVQLLAKPNPPTLISPLGTMFDATRAQAFTLQHNPADSTAITGLEIQYRTSGSTGAYTSTGKKVVSAGQWSTTANLFAQSANYEYQARAWGQHVDPSNWSSSGTFGTRPAPTGTITKPTAASGVNGDVVLATWDYYSSAGAGQSSASLILRDDLLVEIERLTVTGSATSAQFNTRVNNGTYYRIDLTVTDANGVTSNLQTLRFLVTYVAPPLPEVTALWDPMLGAVTLTIDNPGGAGATAASNSVYRHTDGRWVHVATVGLNTSVKDPIPGAGGSVDYEVRTLSMIGSTATRSVAVSAPNSGSWYWLNSGANFETVTRFRLGAPGPVMSSAYGRETALVTFSGRRSPRVYSGSARRRTIRVEAMLENDDLLGSPDAVCRVIDEGGTLCFRDPIGRRFFVNMPDASFGEGVDVTSFSATLTEVSHAE